MLWQLTIFLRSRSVRVELLRSVLISLPISVCCIVRLRVEILLQQPRLVGSNSTGCLLSHRHVYPTLHAQTGCTSHHSAEMIPTQWPELESKHDRPYERAHCKPRNQAEPNKQMYITIEGEISNVKCRLISNRTSLGTSVRGIVVGALSFSKSVEHTIR